MSTEQQVQFADLTRELVRQDFRVRMATGVDFAKEYERLGRITALREQFLAGLAN